MGKINDAAASTIVLDNVMLVELDGSSVVVDGTDQVLDGSFDNWVSTGWVAWSPNGNTSYQSRWRNFK
mgnify:CR=1 FL=1